eukprot:10271768-Lingulodinium_polyedra.AAC.1
MAMIAALSATTVPVTTNAANTASTAQRHRGESERQPLVVAFRNLLLQGRPPACLEQSLEDHQ